MIRPPADLLLKRKRQQRPQGYRVQCSWQLLSSVNLGFAYTWLDATEEDNFSGKDSREIRRPKHIASANLNWVFLKDRANLNLNVDYNGKQDDFFFPPVPPYQERVELDDFTLVTLRLQLPADKTTAAFWPRGKRFR